MKRIIFIFCILFGISLSACPLDQKPDVAKTHKLKWINLVAGKVTFDPKKRDEKLVFDQSGNLKWKLDDIRIYEYQLVKSDSPDRGIYQKKSTKNYIGIKVTSDGFVELFIARNKNLDSINWSTPMNIFGRLQ